MSGVPAPVVFVVDDVVAKPGQGLAFLDAYLTRYAPGARARGMTLVHRLVSPAYWLPDRSNRLLFVWTVPGAAGAWGMKHAGRQDAALAAWWHEEAPRWIETRARSILAEAADLAKLADV